MPYHYTSFAGSALPLYNAEDDIGPAEAVSSIIDTLGGAFDAEGTNVNRLYPRRIIHRARLTAGATTLKDEFDSLCSLVGTRGDLARVTEGSPAVTTTCQARLIAVRSPHTIDDITSLPIEMEFQPLKSFWAGTDTPNSWYIDGSPKDLVMLNSGNVNDDEAWIRVIAGTVAITALTVATNGTTSFTYSGTVPALGTVIIDCGDRSVHLDGVDDYAHFALDATHVIAPWLRLIPGTNTVVLTTTGGSADAVIRIDHTQVWR